MRARSLQIPRRDAFAAVSACSSSPRRLNPLRADTRASPSRTSHSFTNRPSSRKTYTDRREAPGPPSYSRRTHRFVRRPSKRCCASRANGADVSTWPESSGASTPSSCTRPTVWISIVSPSTTRRTKTDGERCCANEAGAPSMTSERSSMPKRRDEAGCR